MNENSPDIQIKDALPEDAWGIRNVLYKAWLTTYPNKDLGITVEDIEDSYKDKFTEESIKNFQDKIASTPPNQKRLVAKIGDKIVGATTMVRNDNDNQLRTIYILPEFQGQGIGTRLWEEIRKFADPGKKMIVQVATYNEKAINFYKKLGFVDNGKRFVDEAFRMKSGAIIPEMEMEIA